MANTTQNKGGHSSRYCSFCGRNENQVNFLIPSANGVYICDYCAEACAELISETKEAAEHEAEAGFTLDTLPRPSQIKNSLDAYVIGQEEAKIAQTVAVCGANCQKQQKRKKSTC